MSEQKKYDILLLGSTGYTGQMILEYFLKNYNEEIKEGKITLFCGVRKVEKLKNAIRSIIKKKKKEKQHKENILFLIKKYM